MLERVLRAPETGGLARQSGLSPKSTEQLALLVEQTKASYPAQEIAPETMEMWFPLWMELARRHTISALRMALQAHMMESRYFPHPSELRERLEASRRGVANVFVPTTRAEMAKRCGAEVAAKVSELSVEDCAKLYGAESAKRYKAKLEKERGRNGGTQR